jgi:adenosine deaminase
VVYAELRFCPYLQAPGSETVICGEEYCEGIFAGLERGQKEFGVKIRVILAFMRNLPGELLHMLGSPNELSASYSTIAVCRINEVK